MSEFNIELAKLNLEVVKATVPFMDLLNAELKRKEAANETPDIDQISNELKVCSPEGIALNIAIEKRDRYKKEKGLS